MAPSNRKTIWVTGASGFIGQHLCRLLSSDDNFVVLFGRRNGVSLLESTAIFHWISPFITSESFSEATNQFGPPSIIYHLAGSSAVGPSFSNPELDFKRTVEPTLALLEWIRSNSLTSRLIYTSSAAVYGGNYSTPIKECCSTKPLSPYGTHKLIAENLCESYSINFDIDVSILRLFSVFGEHLRKQLIWDLCEKLRQSPDILQLSGSGNELRDWIYVGDVVSIMVEIANYSSELPLFVNVGYGKSSSVSQFINYVCSSWASIANKDLPPVTFDLPMREGDPSCLVADISTLQELNIGFSHTLDEAIHRYVNWYLTLASSM